MRRILFAFLTILFLSQIACKTDSKNEKAIPNNAIWGESIYMRGYQPTTYDELTDDAVEEYAELLKANHIRYAYLFAGPYGKDGHLPSFAFSDTAKRSIQLLKKYYPEIQILPWIGGIQNHTVYIGDSSWVNNALTDTKKLVEDLGVPGVHVDLEFIVKGEPYLQPVIDNEKPGDMQSYPTNVNIFHRRLRELLPNAFISSVVVADLPDTRPWKRKTSFEDLRTLVKYIDQLSFLYYDTHINNRELFSKNCVNLLKIIKNLNDERDIQYLVAIGTFINAPELHKYRDMSLENIPNTLAVIKQSAKEVDPNRQLVDGISIYCDWETNRTEWQEFRENWTDANL